MAEDQDKKLISFLQSLLAEGIKNRDASGVLANYKKSIEYFNGDHLIKSKPKDKGNQVWNKYAEIFENRVAHIASRMPKWKFRPQAEDDVLTQDVVNQVLGDVLWDVDEWEDKSEDALWEAAHAGSCHIKTNISDGYEGFPTFPVISCKSILTDRASSMKNARFIIHLFYKDVKEIEIKYGKTVVAESEYESNERRGTFQDPEISFAQISGGTTMPNIYAQKPESARLSSDIITSVIGKALVAELWFDDYEKEVIPFNENEVNQEHQKLSTYQVLEPGVFIPVLKEQNHPKHLFAHKQYLETIDPVLNEVQFKILSDHMNDHLQYPPDENRFKYPKGRVVGFMPNQNIILYDKANDLPMHWRRAWVKFDYGKLPGSWWGKGLGKDLFDPQDALNHRKNSITMNINLLLNGIRKLKMSIYTYLQKNNLLRKFNNQIGVVVPVYNADDYKVDFPPALPASHFQDMYHDENFMDRVVGNEDVSSGRLPGSDTAGVTVSALITETEKRMNLAIKHWGFAMQQIARNALQIMSEVMSDDIVFRVLGQDRKYINLNWGKLKKNLTHKDIRIDMQSMYTTTRQEKLREALQLRQMGVYDNQAVLERLDDPEKWTILQRQNEIAQLAQIVEMQKQQMDQMGKQLNTFINRQQTEGGKGNVGATKTPD